ncbi:MULTISPECIES: flagellar hook assembly protein FlgD [Pontibacillus]|uniref:Flagellar hook assembly protein FlgD n=1 Tax=Pontibacillus chungwhensis TaxID=265426 RepID=A0ABY8V2V2_9BACI|nr:MULTISPECIES: flagellar hook assembly protein FlgD [Pontibacillus]MCD5322687.1 flagellar hook assembly protein FlgD [Pontibacillus sp. HN14]WIF99963.1 flagellar hook assembly protein FlgD [Pontibacillus chungwhensis]
MTSIDPSLYLKSQQQTRTVDAGSNSMLGKDDFLKILMTQLQNQDPTSPMKDKEFISQMTSFSTLEQMTNMSSAIEKLSQAQNFAPIVKYSSMIGKQVSYEIVNENGTVTGAETSKVLAVTKKQDAIELELSNGQTISTERIKRVADQQEVGTTVNGKEDESV